jgi:hypothetical protein
MTEGWVKIYRKIWDSPVWLQSTPEQKVILLVILLMVNHKQNNWLYKGELRTCMPGQVITSLASIAEKAGKGITPRQVGTAIKKFEKLGFLSNESSKSSRLITVLNWGQYQSQAEQNVYLSADDLFESSKTIDQEWSTNNNEKNEKEEKKRFISHLNSSAEGSVLSYFYEHINPTYSGISVRKLKQELSELRVFLSSGQEDEQSLIKGITWFLKHDYWKNKLVQLTTVLKHWRQYTASKTNSGSGGREKRFKLLTQSPKISPIHDSSVVLDGRKYTYEPKGYMNTQPGLVPMDGEGETLLATEYQVVEG